MFSKYGFHPLEFLTVPDWVYRRMVESSGQPDRRLIDYYRNMAARLGYQSEIYIARVLGVAQELKEARQTLQPGVDYPPESLQSLKEIRPRLLDRYQKLSDSDLLAQTIIFVAKKPDAAAVRQ